MQTYGLLDVEQWSSATWISALSGNLAFQSAFIQYWSPVAQWSLLAFYLWVNDGWTKVEGPPPVDVGSVGSVAMAVLHAVGHEMDKAESGNEAEWKKKLADAHLEVCQRLLDASVYPPPYKWATRWCIDCLATFLGSLSGGPALSCFAERSTTCSHNVSRLDDFRKALAPRPIVASPAPVSPAMAPPWSKYKEFDLTATASTMGTMYFGRGMALLLLIGVLWIGELLVIDAPPYPMRLLTDAIAGTDGATGRGKQQPPEDRGPIRIGVRDPAGRLGLPLGPRLASRAGATRRPGGGGGRTGRRPGAPSSGSPASVTDADPGAADDPRVTLGSGTYDTSANDSGDDGDSHRDSLGGSGSQENNDSGGSNSDNSSPASTVSGEFNALVGDAIGRIPSGQCTYNGKNITHSGGIIFIKGTPVTDENFLTYKSTLQAVVNGSCKQ